MSDAEDRVVADATASLAALKASIAAGLRSKLAGKTLTPEMRDHVQAYLATKIHHMSDELAGQCDTEKNVDIDVTPEDGAFVVTLTALTPRGAQIVQALAALPIAKVGKPAQLVIDAEDP